MNAPDPKLINERQLNEIDALAKRYAKHHGHLHLAVFSLNKQIEQLKRKHLPQIKQYVSDTATAQAELKVAVEAAPKLFTKPKTLIMHGIKVGFAKQKGKIEIADEEKTILLIRKNFTEAEAELLIDTTEKVSKNALANVAAGDLKKIGCTVVADTDAVVIKSIDSDIDKLVTALLKDATEEVAA